MAYYTWSQGFRPRAGVQPDQNKRRWQRHHAEGGGPHYPGGPKQFFKPSGYLSDNLVNNELGFKSEFLSHRLLFQRLAVPDGLEGRSAAIVRPRAPRQHDFRHQRSDLPGEGRRDTTRRASGRGAYGAGLEFVEQYRAGPMHRVCRRTFPATRRRWAVHHAGQRTGLTPTRTGSLGTSSGVLTAAAVQPAGEV